MSEYVKSLRRKGLYGIADYVERLEKAAHTVKITKHGKWLDDPYIWKCSERGKWLMIEQGDADMNYCPHCGKPMDGQENSTAPDDDMLGYRDTV